MSNETLRFKLIIGAISMVVGLAIASYYIMKMNDRNKEFPELSTEDSVNATVSSVLVERGVARVAFSSGLKRSIYYSRNTAYEPDELTSFIWLGDSVSKRAGSDSILIYRNKNTYLFVLDKSIHVDLLELK